MFDPKLTDPHPEAAKTYPQKVHCAQPRCHDCGGQLALQRRGLERLARD